MPEVVSAQHKGGERRGLNAGLSNNKIGAVYNDEDLLPLLSSTLYYSRGFKIYPPLREVPCVD